MIRAVVFDFDGTIADTIPAICEGVNRTMRLYGYPEHTEKAVRTFINYGARRLIAQAMPEAVRENAEAVDRVLGTYDREYGLVYDHTRVAYPGMAELIDRLHKNGLRIGVLSNKQDAFVKRLAQQVLVPGSYDAAHGVGAGQPAKPDPFLSHLVADELGVLPQECIMVGDSDIDILTAKNAGMMHIGISWGYRDEAFLLVHGATVIAHTPDEIEALVVRQTGAHA